MIIAIEGGSAAGKTTWCRSYFPRNHVPETPADISSPDPFADPAEVSWFWVNHATQNWLKALEIEREHGLAICDGDPFHLYFAWALWKAGALSRKLFDLESAIYRIGFEEEQIGFVDHVVWIDVPARELRQRAAADTTRRRKRHELYLTMLPWMKIWFEQRHRLLPGTVHLAGEEFKIEELQSTPSPHRYDVAMLDRLLQRAAELEPYGGMS